jgi:hypothetical protein
MFKTALKRLKSNESETFAHFQEALFSNAAWDFIEPDYIRPGGDFDNTPAITLEESVQENEKSQVMNSFKDFYNKQSGPRTLEKKLDIKFETADINYPDLQAKLSEHYGESLADKFFDDKAIEVLFITDQYFDSEASEGDIFDHCFEDEVAMLFRKMVGAMNLKASEFKIAALNSPETLDLFKDIVNFYTPKVVVTLGAKAISKLLDKKTRLSSVHGQRYLGDVNSYSFDIFPIFHPAYLLFNQDMKKTTWSDMQKIMKQIGKL